MKLLAVFSFILFAFFAAHGQAPLTDKMEAVFATEVSSSNTTFSAFQRTFSLPITNILKDEDAVTFKAVSGILEFRFTGKQKGDHLSGSLELLNKKDNKVIGSGAWSVTRPKEASSKDLTGTWKGGISVYLRPSTN